MRSVELEFVEPPEVVDPPAGGLVEEVQDIQLLSPPLPPLLTAVVTTPVEAAEKSTQHLVMITAAVRWALRQSPKEPGPCNMEMTHFSYPRLSIFPTSYFAT